MRMDIAAQTDIGLRKKDNEDCYGVFREDTPGLELLEEGALLCVADGLGGHVGGAMASKLAVSILKDALRQRARPSDEEDDEQHKDADDGILEVLSAGITRANDSIHQTNRDLVTSGRPMGTTLLAVVVTPGKAYVANVGDSRCYQFRDGEIIEKTEDHSWVDEQVKLGIMSRSEAESDRRRNLVTRCIGTHPEVQPDTYVWPLAPGDKLLLCTDGLVNMAKDEAIRDEVLAGGTAAETAQRLTKLANDNGGRDNTTVIVAHVSPGPFQLMALHAGAFLRRHGKTMLWALAALAFGALCFGAGYYVRGRYP